MTNYKMTIRPLTAVHIGSGNTITPMEYTVGKSNDGRNFFYRFMSEDIIENLTSKEMQEFNSLVDKDNIVELRNFLGIRAQKTSKSWLYLSEVTNAFKSYYDTKIGSELNSLEIEECYRSPAKKAAPVIPGSSIKGAIRTALLNSRVRNYANQNELSSLANRIQRFDSKFQQKVISYSKPNDDPFRMLAIGDCEFAAQGSQTVGSLVQYKPKNRYGSPFESIAIFAELVMGALMGKNINATCSINFIDELKTYTTPAYGTLKDKAGKKLVDKPCSMEEIIESCDDFYHKVFNAEWDKFFCNAKEPSIYNTGTKMEELVDALQESNEHLLRIGRWSHVEAVTVENFRKPKNMRGYGNTRTLLDFDRLHLPMGWCAFKIEKE